MTRTKLITEDSVWNSIEEIAPRAEASSYVADDIAEQIQRLIITQDMAAGERLPSERDLARILSASRPTVSQAIRILVTRGLVESRRGSGAYVTRQPESSMTDSVSLMLNLRPDSVGNLNELRLWLETTGVLAAIERAEESDLEAARGALADLQANAGDTAAWMSADTRFHAMLVRASRNPFLASIYESVHASVINYEYRGWIANGTVPEWLRVEEARALDAVHEPILKAVIDRDPVAARAAVEAHHAAMSEHLATSQGSNSPS